MAKLPQDCSARKIGAKARQIVHASFDIDHWEYHEITGTDHGTDCILELIENDEYRNHKIEGQIKGTRNINKLKNGDISFSMDAKTLLYGLGSANAFVLFLVDVDTEEVFYLPIQDYFISDISRIDKLLKNKETMNVHLTTDNLVSNDDSELQEIAKSVYIRRSTNEIYKVG